jgi:copper chaperone CopZ
MLLVAALTLICQSDETGPAKCKAEGLHLCCKGCEKAVHQVLDKVRGVSDVTVDRGARTVTWQAKNDKAVDAAVSALVDAGFHFTVMIGDKKLDVTTKTTGLKADEIVIRNVHACCEDCEKAIEDIFKEAKVTFAGMGPQKDVTVKGKDLDADDVLRRLEKAGFQGVIADKKKK